MFNKEIKFDSEAKESIRKGIDTLANAVGSTFGPKGNLVVIGKYLNGKPHVTKDGVTVAKNINFSDEYMDAGAAIIKEAALKQLVVGDGTTTTTILAQKLIHTIDCLLAEHVMTTDIKEQLEFELESALHSIEKCSKSINSIEDLEKIATISANNDSTVGKLIADAFEKITKDGVITVDESNNIDTTIDVISGMQFDRGYVSSYFCTDNIKNIVELENAYIFITNQKINRTKDIVDIVENVYKEGRPLLIIAEDFDSEVINTLALNMSQGLKICCVKCPSFGDYRTPVLEDLGILTNGSIATYENTIEPKQVTIDMLGQADKIIITKDSTTIMGGHGDTDEINKRVLSIKQQLTAVNSDPQHAEYLTKYYESRIAKLAGGIAVIHVGGVTELEMKEKKDRIDDAIAATKAAIEEGIVPGGGIAYFKAANALHTKPSILKDALMLPISMLIESCDAPLNETIKSFTSDNSGFDAKAGVVVSDMFEAGIVDPTKTVKMALINAVSVAELYLMTNCVIVPETINQ